MKVPEKLQEIQVWMGGLLRRPLGELDLLQLPQYDEEMKEGIQRQIIDGPILSADRRAAIYHQQYWFRLLNLLQEDYPVLVRLLGFRGFNQKIAEPYLLWRPIDHWCLAFLGSHLPAWVEEMYWESDRLAILGICRLEEACRRLFFAPRLPPLEEKDLENLDEVLIFLQPCITFLSEQADFFSLRKEVLQLAPQEEPLDSFPKIELGKRRYFLLEQRLGAFHCEEVDETEHLLLQAFQKGAKLEDILCLCPIEKREMLGGLFYKLAKNQFLTLHPGF